MNSNLSPEQKSKNRLFFISLISVISLVLVLVIALFVVVLTRSQAPIEPASQTVFLPTDDAPKEDKEPPIEEEPEQDQPVETGLSFTTNGDGTCRLSGLGTCTDACVIIPETSPEGDLVTEIDAEAFMGKSGIAAIQIPSTVQSIGARAFADCKDLLYISVSSKNRVFCDLDGVLYSKDKRVLLQYPPLCATGSIKIPLDVKEIREMAFYNCPYLVKIYYAGSAADWDHIEIGAKNYALSAAAKQFYSESGGK